MSVRIKTCQSVIQLKDLVAFLLFIRSKIAAIPIAAMIPPISAITVGLKTPPFTILVSAGKGTPTLNDAKLVKSFESIFVITLYWPESGKR